MSTTEGTSTSEASGSIVTFTVREDRVAVVTIDDTNETLNTIGPRFGEELTSTLAALKADANVIAMVVRSGKKDSFVVGANIEFLSGIRVAQEAEKLAGELAKRLGELRAGKPIVAAVHGAALGGGFELALAAHAIVATDDKKTVLGLPEVKLGLLPAANGMLRVAERAGLACALDLALTGKNLRPAKAKKLLLVDEVCPEAVLIDVAAELAKRLSRSKVGPNKKPGPHGLDAVKRFLLEENALGKKVLFSKAREATRKKTRGHYPATERILDVLELYGKKGFSAAAALEAKAFGELVVSETSRQLRGIFFATTALKKDTGVDDPKVVARPVSKIGMLGAGLMGGGIAYVTSQADIAVRLKDKDDAGVGRGLKYVREIYDERVKRKSMTREERDQKLALVSGTTDYSGMKSADIVIEAVFEDLAVKHAVLKEVEAATSDTCIFASNTSSLPITHIAETSSRPENVVGMHYFSPVHKMPLLEIVRAKRTSDVAVATCVALGKKQGKTVIVVNDGVGFYTTRILAPYLNEAAYLVAEGVAIETIDKALLDWGFPVGPIKLVDEVGIDVGAHVGKITLDAFGERMRPPAGLEKLVSDGRAGKKNKKGFYLYEGDKKTAGKKVDPSVYTLLGVTPDKKLLPEEIQMRCALAFVNEAVRCLEEGILRSPRDGDIGAVFGLGFPPFRGGPFAYVDTVGAKEIVKRLRAYEARFGARFTPAKLLIEKADTGTTFH
jgi:3-hydroxyacyl-CoA dehydrogenase / enoyl-CoA hydratase / 3-hydroxybutyryl-CoA epimerase